MSTIPEAKDAGMKFRIYIDGDQDLREKPLAPFAAKIVRILQDKYYRREATIEGCGKKFL